MAHHDFQMFEAELTAALSDVLRKGGPEAGLAQALRRCAAEAEAVCAGREMACRSRCPHCCVLNVSVLLPEAMLIAETLVSHLPAAEWGVLRGRLAHHCSWVRWMDDEERIMRQAACPLLDSAGNCSIHPLRPLACRGVASLDGDACRSAFDPIIDDRERSVPADLLRRKAYDHAFMALARALAHHGLDDRSIELGTGILAFAVTPGLTTLFTSGGRLPCALWE